MFTFWEFKWGIDNSRKPVFYATLLKKIREMQQVLGAKSYAKNIWLNIRAVLQFRGDLPYIFWLYPILSKVPHIRGEFLLFLFSEHFYPSPLPQQANSGVYFPIITGYAYSAYKYFFHVCTAESHGDLLVNHRNPPWTRFGNRRDATKERRGESGQRCATF